MLSRVADSIYWMARYVERAENLARFIDVTLNLILDQPPGSKEQWEPLILATGDQEDFKERYGAPTADSVIYYLTFDRDYGSSIMSVLRAARENARSIRETISTEAWEQLNEFYYFVKAAMENGRALESPSDFFGEIKKQSHLFNGIVDSTMTHGEGWHFLNLGRHLERADKTSRILDVKYFTLLPSIDDVGTPIDDLQWSSVLRSVSGFEMYRKLYHGITIHRVVEFLILSREFPRSVQYSLMHADESLHQISGSPTGDYRNSAEQQLGQLRSRLAYLDVDSIINGGVHEFVDSLQVSLNNVGESIFETFLAMRPVAEAV